MTRRDPGAVLLVCMPFGHAFSPSLGLSLLKAGLAARGVPARVRYFSIPFAERIGQSVYYGIANEGRPSLEELAGEWIFSRALFGEAAGDESAYVEQVLRKRTPPPLPADGKPFSEALIARLLRVQGEVEGFLDWCLEEVLRDRPRVVGFTSMFQQHVASLALARRIKASLPEAFVVFGGANCEDVMGAETVRQFPFVDAVVSGEADLVFPELVERALAGRTVSGLPGVRTRDGVQDDGDGGAFGNAPMVANLDALPFPDYQDFFEQFAASRFEQAWQPSIFFETSRGCWWGERMHCTFCGLNGRSMSYRSKSARRAVEELVHLAERHPGCDLEATDNILSMGYFEDFLPELRTRRIGVGLFYEVKANLTKERVRLLRDAGVRRIQPGIESLSDAVLKRMRKGVSALQNIQLLKWCKELGIETSWNLIWGFPGEPPGEYERMAGLVPLLTHLPPPESFGAIRLDRFSPNFFDAERLGITDVVPLLPYRLIFPLPPEAVANLASFFTFRYREPQDVGGYTARLEREMRAWRRAACASELFSVRVGDALLVWDLRPAARRPLTVLRGLERRLYEECDAASDVRHLASAVQGPSRTPPAEAIEAKLQPLAEAGLAVRDGSRCLALAVPLGEYAPSGPAVTRFYEIVRALGRRSTAGWVVPLEAPGVSSRPSIPTRRARSRRRLQQARVRALTEAHFSIHEGGGVLIRPIRDAG